MGKRIVRAAFRWMAATALLPVAQAHAADLASPEARWNAVAACAASADERERHACIDGVLRDAGVITREVEKRDERQRFGSDRTQQKAPEPEAMALTLASVTQARDGKLTLTTEDGAVWRQIESMDVLITPRPGQILTVHRASFGSFLCQVSTKTFRCSRSR